MRTRLLLILATVVALFGFAIYTLLIFPSMKLGSVRTFRDVLDDRNLTLDEIKIFQDDAGSFVCILPSSGLVVSGPPAVLFDANGNKMYATSELGENSKNDQRFYAIIRGGEQLNDRQKSVLASRFPESARP